MSPLRRPCIMPCVRDGPGRLNQIAFGTTVRLDRTDATPNGKCVTCHLAHTKESGGGRGKFRLRAAIACCCGTVIDGWHVADRGPWGRRAGQGGKGGKYLVRPDFRGQRPDGYHVGKSPPNRVACCRGRSTPSRETGGK